jgi:hypothetical protein
MRTRNQGTGNEATPELGVVLRARRSSVVGCRSAACWRVACTCALSLACAPCAAPPAARIDLRRQPVGRGAVPQRTPPAPSSRAPQAHKPPAQPNCAAAAAAPHLHGRATRSFQAHGACSGSSLLALARAAPGAEAAAVRGRGERAESPQQHDAKQSRSGRRCAGDARRTTGASYS